MSKYYLLLAQAHWQLFWCNVGCATILMQGCTFHLIHSLAAGLRTTDPLNHATSLSTWPARVKIKNGPPSRQAAPLPFICHGPLVTKSIPTSLSWDVQISPAVVTQGKTAAAMTMDRFSGHNQHVGAELGSCTQPNSEMDKKVSETAHWHQTNIHLQWLTYIMNRRLFTY